MRILSIDIGTKNPGLYIEEFDPQKITEETLYTHGKRVYWKRMNFTKNTSDVLVNVSLCLDKDRKIFDTCNGIIVEKQHKLNYRAQVIEHVIIGYFKALYGPFKYISNISATLKTQLLGAPKKMDKPARKKWAVQEVHRLCDRSNDLEGLKILYSGKPDDLADARLQLKAFLKLVFILGKSP